MDFRQTAFLLAGTHRFAYPRGELPPARSRHLPRCGGGGIARRSRARLSKKVLSLLGPLCEGAPPAGGGGENCTADRNISGYGKVLSLRPYAFTAHDILLLLYTPLQVDSLREMW